MRCQKTDHAPAIATEEDIVSAFECWKDEGHLDAHEAIVRVTWSGHAGEEILVDEIDPELLEYEDTGPHELPARPGWTL